MKHEFAIFICRCNPIHLGHLQIIRKGLEVAEKVIIVLGSHNRATNIKNPWSSQERQIMIESCFSEEELKKFSFVFLKDYLYNDTMWTIDLQNKIAEATNDAENIALIGYKSDASSFYLDLFPKFKYYNCPTDYDFHATEIREKIFTKDLSFKECVHPNVDKFITQWMSTEEFDRLKDEYDYIVDYKERWRGAPFEPIFCTVDCLLIKSGHILLVRRGKKHGKGLFALPGGFLNSQERTVDGAVRELKEETAIKISKEELKKHITHSHVFDHPARSVRGRSISHAFMINLGVGELPKVKGQDDADRAFFLPLNEVLQREQNFFEDHFYIIQHFINKF